MDLLKYFPYNSFRPFQEEAILKIDKAFNDGYKYVILESPTGSGKSAIAMTIALNMHDAYLLTSQKVLQDQYIKDFTRNQDIKVLKGRSNYPCVALNEKEDCSKGICAVQKCTLIPNCHYYIARNAALKAEVALLNYSYFLKVKNFQSDVFKSRKLLIQDEAHKIGNDLMNHVEFRLSEIYLDRLGIVSKIPLFNKIEEYISWIEEIKLLISERVHKFIQDISDIYYVNEEKAKELIEEKERLETLRENMDFFLGSFETTPWIFDIEKSEKLKKKTIIFKPLTVSDFAYDKLFSGGEKNLLMSATILDYKSFTNNLGINQNEAKFIRVPSTFPIENRKIYFTNTGRMSYKEIDNTLPNIVKDIKKILEYHKGEKGIIHTHSYKISHYLEENLDDNRLIFHDTETREEAFKKHCKYNDDSVLVSPSMTDGIDLPDDLARFCVIIKLPYPSLADKQVKMRMEMDRDWYIWLTCLSIIQSSGRGIRHEEDYCTIYLMDSGMKNFIKYNRKNFPDYFINSIKN